LRTLDRAQLLIRAGQAGEALPLLSEDPTDTPLVRVGERLLRAEALLALEDRTPAADLLNSLLQEIAAYDIGDIFWRLNDGPTTYRDQAESLIRQL
jgi:hypothetical protein